MLFFFFVQVTDHPNGRAMAGLKTYLHRRQIPTQLTGDFVLPPNTFGSTFVLVFDGQILCRLPTIQFDYWVNHLRDLKQKQLYGLASHLEIAAFPPNTRLFPGIFIFSYPGRLVRAVKHLQSNTLEYIGPLSQPWMHIACVEEEVNSAKKCWEEQEKKLDPLFYEASQESNNLKTVSVKDISENLLNNKIQEKKKCQTSLQEVAPVKYTHVELSPNLILSITAALTPFSHNNQSPRNMYQCQMLKQTMATPFYSIPYRTDNKAYRLIYPQYPLVTTNEYQEYQWNEHPSGTNAIVAVISYTGFDMEDAMILNKASMERGAFHATVYKTKVIDAAPASARGVEAQQYRFSNSTPEHQPILHQLDIDGLPSIGTMLKKDTPFYRTTTIEGLASDSATRPTGQVFNYHDDEMGYVDKVNFISYPDISKESRLGTKGSLSAA
jgi:DNA-directed RNA polymerase I subunit RPA2